MTKKKITTEKLIKNVSKKVVPLKGKDFFDGEMEIIMPFAVAAMQSDEIRKIQLDIILCIIAKIQEVLRNIINQKKNEAVQLTLFADEELGINPRHNTECVNMTIYLKDFGVSAANYEKLASALVGMVSIPVSLPYTSPSGRDYHKYTNFCDVYFPDVQPAKNKYCIVKMDKEVAEHVRKMDLGYLHVRKKLSRALNTVFSGKLYWYAESFKKKGGFSMSIKEFRKMFGIEDKYEVFSQFESKILNKSLEEIKGYFEKGYSPFYIDYDKIYDGRRKSGEPDRLVFKIIGREGSVEKLLNIQEKSRREEIFKRLNNLGLSESISRQYANRVNTDNYEAFLNQVYILESIFSDPQKKKDVGSGVKYIIKSLNNFFVDYAEKVKAREEAIKIASPLSKWNKIQEAVGKGQPYDVMEVFSQILFGSYNEGTNEVVLYVPSADFASKHFQEGDCKNILRGKIHEYFGKETKLQLKVNKED